MRMVFKIIKGMAVLQDGEPNPDNGTLSPHNIERKTLWANDHLYKVEMCVGFCTGECAAKGCLLFPHEGNVFEGDTYSDVLRNNLISLTRNITTSFDRVKALVNGKQFPLSNEKKLQLQLEALFTQAGLFFKREYHFNQKDIVDFFFPIEGIALEVKIKGSSMAIYRQLKRYAKQPQVKEIILLTAKPMTLPTLIEGKPADRINLAKAWL